MESMIRWSEKLVLFFLISYLNFYETSVAIIRRNYTHFTENEKKKTLLHSEAFNYEYFEIMIN